MSERLLHSIYVQTGDVRSNELTTKLLTFIKANSPIFKAMGLSFQVQKFNRDDLSQPYVNKMLRSKGIDRLPALVTRNKVYHGVDTIIDTYQQTINYYRANNQKTRPVNAKRRPVAKSDDQLVRDYIDSEMKSGMPGSDRRQGRSRRRRKDSSSDDDMSGSKQTRDLERRYNEEFHRRQPKMNQQGQNKPPSSIEKMMQDINDDYTDSDDSDTEFIKKGRNNDSNKQVQDIMNLSDDDCDDRDSCVLRKYLGNYDTTFR